MGYSADFIQELASQIATAEKEARSEAANETNPARKSKHLAAAEKLKKAYGALHD